MTVKKAVKIKYGIKETTEVMQFGFAMGKAYLASKADGSIDASDLRHLVPVFPKFIPMLEDIDQILKELGDLDKEDLDKLILVAKNELGDMIDDAKILDRIEKSIKFGLAGLALYKSFK